MQTMNQCLATLYQKRLITLETAMGASSLKDELEQMIARGAGVVAGAACTARAGNAAGRARRRRRRGRGCGCGRLRRPLGEAFGRIMRHMPTFAYSGRTDARRADGHRRAGGRHDGRGVARCAASRSRSPGSIRSRRRPEAEKKARRRRRGKSVPAKNLAIFTRQFSVMIDAGLPLVQCLDILGKQEPHKGFSARHPQGPRGRRVGRALADAMKKHPKTFDALYSNMIAAGEAGGILDTILKRLAVYIEKNVKLKGEVKSAMIYPVAVIVIADGRRRRDSVEGHPDVRPAVRRPRRAAAAADPRRHRGEQRPRGLRLDPHRRARRDRLRAEALLRDRPAAAT